MKIVLLRYKYSVEYSQYLFKRWSREAFIFSFSSLTHMSYYTKLLRNRLLGMKKYIYIFKSCFSPQAALTPWNLVGLPELCSPSTCRTSTLSPGILQIFITKELRKTESYCSVYGSPSGPATHTNAHECSSPIAGRLYL